MRSRKLRSIARRWWPSHGGDYDWERVERLYQRPDIVPDLIRNLVETAPQGAITDVGTAIVEDIALDYEGREHVALDLVLKAGLSRDQLFEVLGGCYSHYLENLGVPDRLAGLFSPAQIAWLMNEDTLRLPRGRALLDGDGVRVDPHETPWQKELSRSVAAMRQQPSPPPDR